MLIRRYYPALQGDVLDMREWARVRERINHMLERMLQASASVEGLAQPTGLSLSLSETPEHYTLKAAVPGVAPETLEIEATENTIALEAVFPGSPAEETALVQELPCGRTGRTLTLPEAIVPDAVSADCRHGVLTLTLPKAAARQRRTIRVAVDGE